MTGQGESPPRRLAGRGRRPEAHSWTPLLLYNMRHVQHHAGQLNVLLRREIDAAPRWVAQDRPAPATDIPR